MKRWHFILILIAAVLIAVWLSGGFNKKTTEKAPVSQAPSVTQPTQPAPVIPTAETEVEAPVVEPTAEVVEEEPGIVELGTGEMIAVGLKDPNVNPVVKLEPNQGVLWSSDPGGANASGQVIDYENKGSMGYIFNDSDDPIEVVFHTGWNSENERWNISPVLFKVNDLKALREHTLTINVDEQKPLFFGKIWNGSELLNDPDL